MHIERLFSAGSLRPQDSMSFSTFQIEGLTEATITAPSDWTREAVQAVAEALCPQAPLHHQALEENTMPSWLWRHKAFGPTKQPESHVLELFDRIAGAATYKGWQRGLWQDEISASTFFDEVRALLLTRRLVIAPDDMVNLGLNWAYGLNEETRQAPKPLPSMSTLILQNETIDGILRTAHPAACSKWNRYLQADRAGQRTSIVFADTVSEWGTAGYHRGPRAALNLLAFRQEDGTLDVVGLTQATRITVMLLDLHADTLGNPADTTRPLSLALGNLAALMMSLGQAYDSREARSTTAGLAALVTATAVATSADLAAKLRPCLAFQANREILLRKLQNMQRAVYGEKTDYDRLSILPQSLDIDGGADLILLAAARYAWDEAIERVQKYGLRHLQLTDLFDTSSLAPLLDSSTFGVEAEHTLVRDYEISSEHFERRIHPAVPMALERLGYDRADIKAVVDHLVGYHTLVAAPGINHAVLRERGFTDEALDRLEAYLPQARHLRFAFTPWVLGVDFCRTQLGLSEEQIKTTHFDLLAHLGFSAQDVVLADRFCCGHPSVKGVLELADKDLKIFLTQEDQNPMALIAMAGAVQSFIMGDVGLSLFIPASVPAEARGEMILTAWKMGLHSLTLTVEGSRVLANAPAAVKAKVLKRKTARISTAGMVSARKKSMTHVPSMRTSKAKAPSRAVSMKRGGGKSPLKGKRT